MLNILNIVGLRYNRLTILEDLGLFANGLRKVIALCDCGIINQYNYPFLKSGHTRSCGCLATEILSSARYVHGLSKHPLYKTWIGIKTRCYTKSDEKYPKYGAVGVKMCDKWLSDFLSFYSWALENGWKRGMQIDKDIIPKKLRIPALLYSPDMCSVVTSLENNNARSSNIFVEFMGESKTLSQWERIQGLPKSILSRRLSMGWDIKRALTTKPQNKNRGGVINN